MAMAHMLTSHKNGRSQKDRWAVPTPKKWPKQTSGVGCQYRNLAKESNYGIESDPHTKTATASQNILQDAEREMSELARDGSCPNEELLH